MESCCDTTCYNRMLNCYCSVAYMYGNKRIIIISGEIFTSILKDYLFDHLVRNDYMLTSIQKGFIDRVSGCMEHQFTVVSVI